VNIALKYNSVYTNAFQQVLKDIYKKNGKNKDNYNEFNVINPFLYGEIYDKWLKNSNNHLDKLLKSRVYCSAF
jgi:hypothetical protein